MAQFKGDQGGGNYGGGVQGRGQYFSTRQSKIDFSRFNGDDLNGWLYRCHQFFDVDQTPLEAKLKLAAINLEGKALQ